MARRSRILAVTATALVVAAQLLLETPAAPAGPAMHEKVPAPRGWPQPWEPVRTLAANPRGESLTVDAHDNVTVVWATGSPAHAVKVLRRPAGGHWVRPVVVGHGYDPQVVADARGSVTVAWLTQRRGFTDGVAAVRRPAGGHWSEPVRLSRDLPVPGYPRDGEDVYGAADLDVAASGRGAVAVAWAWGSDERTKPWRVQAAYRPVGGAWTRARNVTPADGARQPQVGIDARGAATVVYGRQPFGRPQVLLSRSRPPGGGWTRPSLVSSEGYGHQLAVDRAGDALVVFTPDFNAVRATSRTASGRWRRARTLSPAGVEVNDFALAANGRGAAVVALGRGNGRVDLLRRPPRGVWSQPARVARPGVTVYDVLAALNGTGDTFVGWGGYALYGKYRPHGGRWSRRVTISPDAGVEVLEATSAQVTPGGDVVVLWKQEARPLKVRVMSGSLAPAAPGRAVPGWR